MGKGLKGQVRLPNTNLDPRVRRNSASLASQVLFIGANEVIQLNGAGELTVVLKTDGGLQNNAGELEILLNPTNPCLSTASGLNVTVISGSLVSKNATGLDLDRPALHEWIDYYSKGAI